jgi:cullin-associated NEDD8-dissociated protein 1
MAALTAAILLDREARSSTLDYDLIHGSLREPILKVIHFMRAMEYKTFKGREIAFKGLEQTIGQNAFLSPSVFNYYLAEYEPTGPLEKAKLVSPEAELSTAPLIVGFMNGMSSLVQNGLTNCDKGFASSSARPVRGCRGLGQKRTRLTADGNLSYVPTSTQVSEIVAEMSLLLADGRMSDYTQKIIAELYNATYASTPVRNITDNSKCGSKYQSKCSGAPAGWNWCDAEVDGRCHRSLAATARRRRRRRTSDTVVPRVNGSAAWDFDPDSEETITVRSRAALKAAQTLAFSSAAFHATNADLDTGKVLRPAVPAQKSAGRPFKAVIVIFLGGAADSYNLLVPHTCAPTDLHTEYLTARTNVAIPKAQLLPIDSPAEQGQPCSTFGLHPALKNIQDMYNKGDAVAVANVGSLVVPLTPDEYKKKTKPRPPGLFSHNVQQRVMHSVHAQYQAAKGVLGRMVDAVVQQVTPFSSSVFSLIGNVKTVEGSVAPIIVDRNSGIPSYTEFAKYKASLYKLSNPLSSSLFADTHKDRVASALNTTQALGALLNAVELDTEFGTDSFGSQMKQVAKLIKMRNEEALDMERGAFIVSQGGFDTHTDVGEKLQEIMTYVDDGVGKFKAEMEAQGLWDGVTLLTVSDFGRTLTSNGQGTDHAWAGNHFIMGGDVKGGKVHGKYPPSLLDTHELNLGRGRLLPTTPWEGMWKSVAEWFGVEPGQMSTVLPNAKAFPDLLGKEEMFDNKPRTS